jgi:hypothetical protein
MPSRSGPPCVPRSSQHVTGAPNVAHEDVGGMRRSHGLAADKSGDEGTMMPR